jgi:hypothetical protein
MAAIRRPNLSLAMLSFHSRSCSSASEACNTYSGHSTEYFLLTLPVPSRIDVSCQFSAKRRKALSEFRSVGRFKHCA